MRSQSPASRTSARTKIAEPPAASIAATTLRPRASSRPVTVTLAPSSAKRSADASPMPDVAPVMIAMRSWSFMRKPRLLGSVAYPLRPVVGESGLGSGRVGGPRCARYVGTRRRAALVPGLANIASMRGRWLVVLALLAIALTAFGIGLPCAESCSESRAGECAPMCTLCGTCALPALASLPVVMSRDLEPSRRAVSPGAPRLLAGIRPPIFHVPRPSTS
jgi:hypothetical protein